MKSKINSKTDCRWKESESELAAKIEKATYAELQHKLDQASIVANRDGVVTWVNRNIGSTVQQAKRLQE
jgi:HlyD family secretion protein